MITVMKTFKKTKEYWGQYCEIPMEPSSRISKWYYNICFKFILIKEVMLYW